MNTNTISRPKKSTSIRIDAEIFDKIKSIADEEHRSFSNYIESLLIKTLGEEPLDRTGNICQALREVKMIKEGKIEEPSMDELINEL